MVSGQSASLRVAAWLLSVGSICFVIVRFATKWAMTRRWTIDDTMIVFALTFSVSQSILLTVATSYGYGNPTNDPDDSQLLTQEKFICLSNIMFFFSMCFGMLSIIQLILGISPQRRHQIISWILSAATVLWAVIATLAFALQCRLPLAWDFTGGQCFRHQKAFYTFIICANILIELGLILQPVLVLSNLQLARRRKLVVMATFSSRSIVVAALIAWAIFVWLAESDAEIVLTYGFTICTLLVDNFSIMAASVPYLRPFLHGLEHGMMGVEMPTHRTNLKDSYPLKANSSSKVSKEQRSTVHSPRLQTIQDASQWKFEQIDDTSSIVVAASAPPEITPITLKRSLSLKRSGSSMMTMAGSHNTAGNIMRTSEFTVESRPAGSAYTEHHAT